MVMNAEIDWGEICKVWHQRQADYFSAQKALNGTMSLFLQAKGPPPTSQVIKQVDDLWNQMFEARAEVDEFIAAYAIDDRHKKNLPRHE